MDTKTTKTTRRAGTSKKKTATPKRAAGAKQTAAKASTPKAPKKTPARKAAGPKQTQTGSSGGAEGSTSMSQAPMFGGTKQVLIETVAMSGRGGRKQGPELYPFGDLPPSEMDGAVITGPSFFIPETAEPKKVIASGRKRHKGSGKVFLTRQTQGPSEQDPNKLVPGVRVWLAPAGYNS